MERNRDDSARPEQENEEGFAEGQANPADVEVSRDFAEGQERHRKTHRGDFAEGQEHHDHADEDAEGDFAEGQKEDPTSR